VKQCNLYLTLSRLLFVAATLLVLAAVTDHFGFDGVIVRNLNADFGEVHRGNKMTQVVRVMNYSFHPITVLFVPTCGCMVSDDGSYVLGVFQSRDLPITYSVGATTNGLAARDVAVTYRVGTSVRRVQGKVRFTVAQ